MMRQASHILAAEISQQENPDCGAEAALRKARFSVLKRITAAKSQYQDIGT